MFQTTIFEEDLEAFGELLATRQQHFELVAIGGGSLRLLNLITRPTVDLDILARLENGKLIEAEPLPEALFAAAQETGQAMNLDP